jgi:nicotinate-nucleotide adenylyltransferase
LKEPGPRVGIFGGTFDPIHTAHVEVAESVARALGLDRMLLVVANDPWQKVDHDITPAEDRYAMVEAATAGHPGLEPSRLELDRGGPSYTIDTVREIRARHPDAEVVLVVGADVVDGLPTWKDEAALRQLVTLAVVGRPGAGEPPAIPGWRTVPVPASPRDISSTDLRRRLQDGEPVDGLIPDDVIRCIRRRGLYATDR